MAASAPRWKQIHDDLRARIAAGDFADGFPGELQLAAEYDVSRGTMRHALRPLRESGVLTANRGQRPRLLTTSPSAYGAIYSLFEIISHSGQEPLSDTLAQEIVTDARAAERIGLPTDAEVFHLARIRRASGRPVAVDHVWLPSALGEPMLTTDFTHEAVYHVLAETANVHIDGGHEDVSAILAGPDEARLLDCAIGAALLRFERVGTSGGQPVEYRTGVLLGTELSITHRF
ncbi:GntR family transcriptional regulator [Brevibacterium otitidis]|uniref:GntR family transcriptional regulator n=1 Tax=Brevibacterium otitidis TaxID=53364 RepID=A0ABV5X1X2_9MICO|nr:GntR family transcriptional regulator [Brevibacterium otitidis]